MLKARLSRYSNIPPMCHVTDLAEDCSNGCRYETYWGHEEPRARYLKQI